MSEDTVYYVIRYNHGPKHLVRASGGSTPKLYQKKGQAEYLAKRYNGIVEAVILQTVRT